MNSDLTRYKVIDQGEWCAIIYGRLGWGAAPWLCVMILKNGKVFRTIDDFSMKDHVEQGEIDFAMKTLSECRMRCATDERNPRQF